MNGRVCVFCGSSLGSDGTFVELARAVAREIVRAGYGIVYGGGRIGLMGALAGEALAAGGDVIGVIPEALAVSEVAHDGLTRLEVVASMLERKARMVELSDAFVVLPGAFGTMDELFEVLTWRQLGLHAKPIGILNHDGYFDDLQSLFATMTARGFLARENLGLAVWAGNIDALLGAMKLIPV